MSTPENLADELTDAVAEFRSSLPQTNDAFVRIMRRDENGKARMLPKGKVMLSAYTPDLIEERYGGGEFVIELYDGQRGAGAKARPTVFIEGPPRLPPPEAAAAPPPAAMPPAAPALNPDALAASISQSIAQTLGPVLAALARAIEHTATHTPAVAAAPAPTLLDLTQALKNMQELVPKPVPAAPVEPGGQLTQLREIISLAREFAGGTGETGPMDLLEKAIEKIGVPMIAAIQNQTARTVQPHPQGRPMVPTNALDTLPGFAAELMKSAAAEEPPENWVGLTIDRLPPEILQQLLPDPVPILARLDTRATQEPYASWLRALAAEVQEALKPDEAAGNQPPAA